MLNMLHVEFEHRPFELIKFIETAIDLFLDGTHSWPQSRPVPIRPAVAAQARN